MKWPFRKSAKIAVDQPAAPAAPVVTEPPLAMKDPKRPPSHEVPILTQAVLPEQMRQVAAILGKASEILFLIEQGGVIDQDLRRLRDSLAAAATDAKALLTRFDRRTP